MSEPTFQMFLDIIAISTPMLLFLSAAAWLRIRSGTLHGMTNKIYSFILGRKEFHNEIAAEFWRNRQDIERFNAIFNTRTKSQTEIKRFCRWVDSNELDLVTVARSRKRFNFEICKIKKTSTWEIGSLCVLIFVLWIVSMPLVSFAMSESALLQLKRDGTWVWLNHNTAASFNWNPLKSGWVIHDSACEFKTVEQSVIVEKTGLSSQNVDTICNSFGNLDTKNLVDKVLREQKVTWVLVIVLVIIGVVSFRALVSAADANLVRGYVYKKLKVSREKRKFESISGFTRRSAQKMQQM